MGNGSVESGDGSPQRMEFFINWKGQSEKFVEYVKDPNIIKYPILIAQNMH
jgi:hypothetical protein